MASKKNNDNPVFEIVIVLAIVCIVAVTGLVLTNFRSGSQISSSSGISGMVISEQTEEPVQGFIDVGISSIKVNPISPLTGEPFEVTIMLSNEGTAEITTPFYVELKVMPNIEAEPMVLQSVMTKSLKPGESSSLTLKAAVAGEGAYRLVASADSTVKLDDVNSANNMMSKTIIVTNENQ
jgi:hypothetical protein